MIEKQWVNNSTIVSSIFLLVFAMVQVTLALALNLRSNQWQISSLVGQFNYPTTIASAVLLLIDATLIFPCAVVGICAAISRSFKVYVVLMVLTSLAFLGAIGGLVGLTYLFSVNSLFSDSGSVNDEIGISLIVFQCMVMLMLILVGVCAIIGLVKQQYQSRGPYKPKYKRYDSPPRYETHRAPAMRAVSYTQPRRTLSDAGAGYYNRPLTYGSPEWDQFYSDYMRSVNPSGDKYRRPYRSSSYRM